MTSLLHVCPKMTLLVITSSCDFGKNNSHKSYILLLYAATLQDMLCWFKVSNQFFFILGLHRFCHTKTLH